MNIEQLIKDLVREEVQKCHMASKAWVRSAIAEYPGWEDHATKMESLRKQINKLFVMQHQVNKKIVWEKREPKTTEDRNYVCRGFGVFNDDELIIFTATRSYAESWVQKMEYLKGVSLEIRPMTIVY